MSNQAQLTEGLQDGRVGDCMHAGIVTCPGDTPLAEAAALMAAHRVHALAITRGSAGRPIAVLSDLDMIAAIASGEEPTVLQAAATEPLAVAAGASLSRAAQLMREHEVTHLIVVDSASGYPTGVLSSFDVVGAYAGAR